MTRFKLEGGALKVHIAKRHDGRKVVGLCGAQGWMQPRTPERKLASIVETYEQGAGFSDCPRCSQLALK